MQDKVLQKIPEFLECAETAESFNANDSKIQDNCADVAETEKCEKNSEKSFFNN